MSTLIIARRHPEEQILEDVGTVRHQVHDGRRCARKTLVALSNGWDGLTISSSFARTARALNLS